MQFRAAALDSFAGFICGDNPLPFPYRSSSGLNSFFVGLDLDYVHHGETRKAWTKDSLAHLNRLEGEIGAYESAEAAMYAVVAEIMNSAYFETDQSANFEKAIVLMNKTLSPYNLEVSFDRLKSKSTIISTDENFISTAHKSSSKAIKLTISPKVFDVPEHIDLKRDLVAIMMPFGGFDAIHDAIKVACNNVELVSKRADDIWNSSVILQDIFDLICSAEIVIADFTGRNPNVMYETGIAHTLGKHVIPITQTLEHVPSNLHGHRALVYVGANGEGLRKLTSDLIDRLRTIKDASAAK